MIKRILSIFCFLLAVALLAACASGPNLKSTRWQLTELNGQPALEGVTVTLNLEADTLGGSDGCNTYGGSYTSKGSAFKTGGDTFSTMMYCSDEINNQSSAYYTALNQASSFTLQDQTLSLLDASGTVLVVFTAIDQ
jgi:heat shock protein HslJ